LEGKKKGYTFAAAFRGSKKRLREIEDKEESGIRQIKIY
jgi:hypothetical protein